VLFGRAVLPGLQARRYSRIAQIDSGLPTGCSRQVRIRRRQERAERTGPQLTPPGITVKTVAPGFTPR